MMPVWIKNLMTGKDNETYDFIRVAAILGVIQGLGLTLYTVVCQQQHFNLEQFGVGLGAMLGGAGAGIGLKSNTEPDPKP